MRIRLYWVLMAAVTIMWVVGIFMASAQRDERDRRISDLEQRVRAMEAACEIWEGEHFGQHRGEAPP